MTCTFIPSMTEPGCPTQPTIVPGPDPLTTVHVGQPVAPAQPLAFTGADFGLIFAVGVASVVGGLGLLARKSKTHA